ncbi:MAG: M48 family metalloprotease [Holosporales bacterium]|jgi:predicted Zn-dependent protease|nr:M48 family metalloprotease [Holosporales bacterium]
MKKWRMRFIVLLLVAAFSAQSAFSSRPTDGILLDDETENFLQEIIRAITGALGFKQEIPALVSSSQSLNAAATEDGRIIINAGAILRCSDVKELIAIIAHEIGHIDGRHIVALRAYVPEAYAVGLIPMLIGVVATAVSGDSAPLLAGVIGRQSFVAGKMLCKLRQKESEADTRAAQAMKKLGWFIFPSFISLHKKLAENFGGMCAPYLLTHPLPEDRMAKYERYSKEQGVCSPQVLKLLNEWQNVFVRLRAKLNAMLTAPNDVLAITARQRDAAETYARSIALYRCFKYREARAIAGVLSADAAKNGTDAAHYIEIEAMCLIRMKQCAAAAEMCFAVLKNDKGARIIHRDLGLIYGDAVVEGELTRECQFAINILTKIKLHNPYITYVNNLLGKLYALNNQNDEAALCAAETAFQNGDYEIALLHAKKALLSPRTKIRGQDMINKIKQQRKAD